MTTMMTVRHATHIVIGVLALALTVITVSILLGRSCAPFAGQPAILFQGFDTVGRPGQRVRLTCALTDAASNDGLENQPVAFSLPGRRVLLAKTRRDGNARRSAVFDAPGDHQVSALVTDDGKYAGADSDFLVRIQPPDYAVIWVAVATLVPDSPVNPWQGPAGRQLEATAASLAALKELSKSYGMVYLTNGPRPRYRKTRKWLRDAGLPFGPLLQLESDKNPRTMRNLFSCWPRVRAAIAADDELASVLRTRVKETYRLRAPRDTRDTRPWAVDWHEFVQKLSN